MALKLILAFYFVLHVIKIKLMCVKVILKKGLMQKKIL